MDIIEMRPRPLERLRAGLRRWRTAALIRRRPHLAALRDLVAAGRLDPAPIKLLTYSGHSVTGCPAYFREADGVLVLTDSRVPTELRGVVTLDDIAGWVWVR